MEEKKIDAKIKSHRYISHERKIKMRTFKLNHTAFEILFHHKKVNYMLRIIKAMKIKMLFT